MKLERRYARRALALLALGPVCLLLAFLLQPYVWFGMAAWDLDQALLPVRAVLAVTGVLSPCIALNQCGKHLVCPHCEKGVAYPWQRPGQRRYCPRCGRPFLFDDDPEEETP